MKKLTGISLFIFFCVMTAILTAGLVFYQDNKNNNLNTGLTNQNKTADITNLLSSGITVLDSKEIAKHNTNANCWIIVNSKVYDISNYASAHPGGTRSILDYCGKEATVAFDTKGGKGNSHSTSANNLLAQYYIGNLNQKLSQNTLNQNVQNAKSNSNNSNNSNNNLNNNVNNPTPTPPPVGNVVLNSQEVAKHNTVSDCWMIINNKVYNLSDYAGAHPGGTQNITNYCGKEATVAFDTKGGVGNPHSTSANNLLAQYYIGDLNQNISQNTLNQTIQNTQLNPPPQNNRGGDGEDD
ncbi:MAG: cytochrome b5-like heme/steroid binding domain-containing protein [bacterium]